MISTRLLILDMNADDQPGKLTSRDRRAARIWQWLPWLSAAIVAFGPPSVFALISLLASSNAAVYLIVAASLVPSCYFGGAGQDNSASDSPPTALPLMKSHGSCLN